MKNLIFFPLLLVALTSKAQLTVSVKAGTNITKLAVVKNELIQSFHDPKSKVGVFAGVQFDHAIDQRFSVFHALELQQKHFSFKRSYTDYFFEGNYRPVYVSIPVGAQYKILSGKHPVTLSAGAYWEAGVGGKVNYSESGWGPLVKGKRGIGFADDFNHWEGNDLARNGLGLRGGITVDLFKKVAVQLNYDHGLQNMQPATVGDRLVVKYRTLSLGLKYQLKRYK